MSAPLLAAAGLIGVGAITPGPNNLVVMREAARSGFVTALPAIAGVVAGGLAMLALVAAGAGVAFVAEPRLHHVVAAGGATYLCWLGASLVRASFDGQHGQPAPPRCPLPTGALGLFGFQFLNPKSWVMVLTVTSAVGGGDDGVQAYLPLAVLFVVIPALCLSLWCALGVLMATLMDRPAVRRGVDRVMGLLLVASALLLAFSTTTRGFE